MSETEQAIAADPAAKQAAEFADTFQPLDDVNYTWVLEVAKGRYDALVKAFDDLDAKSAALVGYLGSSTGLISLGTFITALNTTVSPLVALAVLPPLALAAAALLCALRARNTANIFPPPAVEGLVQIANTYGKDTEKAKAVMAAQWDICTALMRPVVELKGGHIDAANWYFVWAVLALTLPVLAHVAMRLAG